MARLKSVPLAVLTLIAGTAMAQQQPQPSGQPAQRVEVTGSNIKRTDVETASPITVITREDLQRSGANTLSDVITKLSVAQGGLSGVEFNGFTPGAATISLRGLGGGATLVLINGRRIAPYGITGFQEVLTSVNSIPVAAIDRIDILKDGASAIYGSEAIAGVVNIILRSDYTGLEASLNHTFNSGNVVRADRVGVSGGIGDIARDRYNVFGTYEHVEQKHSVVSQNKFFPSRNLVSLTGLPNQDFRSSYSYPGNITNGGIRTIPGATCDPKNVRTVGGLDRCVLDVFDYNTMTPKISRDSVLGRGVLQVSPSLSAFAELGYSRGDYQYQFDPQFYYNDGATQTLVTDGAPYGLAGPVNLRYRTGDIGPRRIQVLNDETRMLVGLKGSFGSWDFDTALGVMGNKVTENDRGNILISEMEAALTAGTYIPGLPGNSATVMGQISPTLTRRGKSSTTFADFRVSTEMGSLPGGPVGVAAGVDLRKEKINDVYDARYVSGDVFGFGSLEPIDSKRHVESAFVEFNLPIVKTLEAQVAARHDRYSVGGTSTTPKLGVKWTALPTLVVRGTAARGFRAANARETNTATSIGFYNGVQDPVRCPVIDSTNPDCSLSIQANISGNPKLEPEKAKSYTAGFVFELAKDTSVSVDWWRIQRRNEITNLDINFLLANQATYASFIRRDSTGSITDVDLPYVNLAGTTVQGVDVDLRAKRSLGEIGNLSLRAAATYYDKFLIQPAPGAALDNYNGTYGQPRVRANAAVGLERGPWTTEASVNYVGQYLNSPSPGSPCSAPTALNQYCTIGSWTTMGLFVRYKGFRNLELVLNVDNLFDKAPPFDYRAAVNSQTRAWSAVYHNALGRVFGLGVKYTFF